MKSCVNLINGAHHYYGPRGRHDKALKKAWKMIVTMKIKAFGWKCFINKLLTRDALSKRGIQFTSQNVCVFCCAQEETYIHSLLCCIHTILVWKDVTEWIGFVEYKATDFMEAS